MATNPIQASDLIDDGAIQSLERLGTTLENVAKNLDMLKQAIQANAQSMNVQVQQTNIDSQALAEMEKKVEALKAALEATNKLQDENTKALDANTNARQRNNSARQRQSKLNAQELQNIQNLELEIEDLTFNMNKNLSEIDKQNKSYNELYATYNKIKDALNKMTTAERESTNAGRSLTMAAKDIYDEMNKLQMQTGKFQMNVGNYKRAFDGLGYSITQVARELPSLAINANTFFLAISNNIPMVFDEYKKFTQQQEDLQKKMQDLVDAGQGQSEAFRQLESQVMTFGQKMKALVTSFGFWISLLPTLLVFLPKIVGWIKDWVKGVDVLERKTKSATAVTLTLADAAKKYGQSVEELNLIDKKIGDIQRGTKEWKSAIERVNEICHSNLDATTATEEQVKKVTEAYKEQAKQIAINKAVSERIANSDVNKTMREIAQQMADAHDYESLAELLGYKPDSKDYNNLKDNLELKSGINIEFSNSSAKANRVKNIINAAFPILDDAAYQSLEDLVEIVDDPNKKPGKVNKGKTYTHKDIEDLAQQYAMVDSNNMDASIEQRMQLLDDKMEAERAALQKFMDKQIEKYMYNKEHGLLTQEDIDKFAELNDQYSALLESLPKKYEKMKDDELLKYNREVMAQNNKRTEQEIELIELEMKEGEVAIPRRVKSKNDEINKNNAILANIENIKRAMEELEKVDVWDEEHLNERNKKMAELNKRMEQYRNQLDWSKQLANYKNIGDLIGSEGMLEGLAGGDKRGFLGAIGLDMTGASDEQVDSAFEEWMKNAGDAMVKWKDMTIDNLGQMLDAYVEYYQAKADAASEDTDKAKEAYEMQKSLLEQGYANSVNTAWAEYQQKQEIQKKAEEDAKRAQQVQKLADEAQNFSNMVLATSNILKQYSANPIVATGLISTMWLTYGAAKAMALKESKYEHGGYEELTGGSHVSGHDINLGVMNGKGRSMVAEGGESIGIFSRNAKRKYGSQTIGEIVKSINNGTYEKVSAERLNDNVSLTVRPYRGASVNLNKIENTLDSIDRNGKHTSYVDGNGNMVVVNGNSTTTYIKR